MNTRQPIPTCRIHRAVESGARLQSQVANRLGVSTQHAHRLLVRAKCKKVWLTPKQLEAREAPPDLLAFVQRVSRTAEGGPHAAAALHAIKQDALALISKAEGGK